jgi:catechol 2,3-dioxygenase-like lactoylglutathione lyase family enzyme
MGKLAARTGGGLRLHHIALRTARVDETLRFYTTLLGLSIVRDQRPRSVWLGLSDGALLMIEASGTEEPAVPVGSLDLLAFRVSPDEKAAIRERAKHTRCYDGETEHTVYFRDPDGRRLGISTFPLE